MERFARWVWLLTLVAFLSGCSTYQPVSLPRPFVEMAPDETTEVVEVGSYVRVTKIDGTAVSGRIAEMRDEELILVRKGRRWPEEQFVVRRDQIDSIESKQPSVIKSWLVVLSISAIAMTLLYISFSQVDWSEGS